MVSESNNKPIKSLSGGETGEIYFESSNPYSSNHILDGKDKDGKVTVSGMLKIPKSTTDKVGAIVNGDLKFALHIALYPFCYGLESIQMTGAPILILVGEKDDWTHAEPCIECTKALKDAGYAADIIVYPNAYHAFDSNDGVTFMKNALNMKKCRAIIKSNGLAIETTSGLSMDNPETLQKVWEICATKGVHYGKNSSAKKKSMEDVKRFVTKVFGQ